MWVLKCIYKGTVANGVRLNNIRYADDTAFITTSQDGTQHVHWTSKPAEMWFYRRMLNISYLDRVTNEEVLHREQTEQQLLKIIERRQLKFLGHYIRREKLEDLCRRDKINGKLAWVWQRKIYLQNFTQFKSRRELWDATRNRDECRVIHETGSPKLYRMALRKNKDTKSMLHGYNNCCL